MGPRKTKKLRVLLILLIDNCIEAQGTKLELATAKFVKESIKIHKTK